MPAEKRYKELFMSSAIWHYEGGGDGPLKHPFLKKNQTKCLLEVAQQSEGMSRIN